METITHFQKFHVGKHIQEKVRTEIEWSNKTHYLTIYSVSQLDKLRLYEHLNTVLDHAENDTVDIACNTCHIEDLTYLFGERWLSNCLLYQICAMLNGKCLVTKTFIYSASDTEHRTNVGALIGIKNC